MLNYLEVVYKWSFGSSAVAAAVLGEQWEGCAGTQLLLSTALPPLCPWPAPAFGLGLSQAHFVSNGGVHVDLRSI